MSTLTLTNLSVRRATKKAIRAAAKRDGRTIYGVVDQAIKMYERQHAVHSIEQTASYRERNVEGAPTPIESAHEQPPSRSCDSTQHTDVVGGEGSPILKLNGFPTNGTPH